MSIPIVKTYPLPSGQIATLTYTVMDCGYDTATAKIYTALSLPRGAMSGGSFASIDADLLRGAGERTLVSGYTLGYAHGGLWGEAEVEGSTVTRSMTRWIPAQDVAQHVARAVAEADEFIAWLTAAQPELHEQEHEQEPNPHKTLESIVASCVAAIRDSLDQHTQAVQNVRTQVEYLRHTLDMTRWIPAQDVAQHVARAVAEADEFIAWLTAAQPELHEQERAGIDESASAANAAETKPADTTDDSEKFGLYDL